MDVVCQSPSLHLGCTSINLGEYSLPINSASLTPAFAHPTEAPPLPPLLLPSKEGQCADLRLGGVNHQVTTRSRHENPGGHRVSAYVYPAMATPIML